MAFSSLTSSKCKLPLGPFSILKWLKLHGPQNHSAPASIRNASVQTSVQFLACTAHHAHTHTLFTQISVQTWLHPSSGWFLFSPSIPHPPHPALSYSTTSSPPFSMTPLTVCWLKQLCVSFLLLSKKEKNPEIINFKRAKAVLPHKCGCFSPWLFGLVVKQCIVAGRCERKLLTWWWLGNTGKWRSWDPNILFMTHHNDLKSSH